MWGHSNYNGPYKYCKVIFLPVAPKLDSPIFKHYHNNIKSGSRRIYERLTLMKRFLSILFTTLLLTAVLCMSASASDFDSVAEELSATGMFQGTGNGFELDRAPKRSEAAIMLVRLYGAEDEAKTAYAAGEISHPFTDVSEFTSPYVAWLYTNGITNGFTETTYASQRPCSAQNYIVFLLRALGYKDTVDFAYADAMAFAQEKGFYDPELFPGEFLRDDLAALTYQALATDMADGMTYLLDSLISSGAIDKAAAKSMTEKMEAFRALNGVSAPSDTDSIDLKTTCSIDMDITAVVDGMTTQLSSAYDETTELQVAANNGKLTKMGCESKITEDGETKTVGIWLKDGYAYTTLEGGAMKLCTKTAVTDGETLLDEVDTATAPLSSMDVNGLAMVESITAKKSGSDTIYTVAISDKMGGLLDSVADITAEDFTSVSLNSITVVYTVNSKGVLKSAELAFSMTANMEIPMDDGTTVPAAVDCDYEMLTTIRAAGSAVKVDYPDFSEYIEIAPAEPW